MKSKNDLLADLALVEAEMLCMSSNTPRWAELVQERQNILDVIYTPPIPLGKKTRPIAPYRFTRNLSNLFP